MRTPPTSEAQLNLGPAMDPPRSSNRISLLLAAIVLGLAGFVLDIPVNIIKEPIRVSLIFGSVLPMVAAMAWGWKGGLAAATLGLAGLFPLAAWPANGWANIPTCLMNCLWFVIHGWAGAERAGDRRRWWHNPYAIELAFDLLYALYIVTIFRWSFACNPAPWAPAADTQLPLQVACIIAGKTAFNGLLVVLLADVALHMAPLRRAMGLPIIAERRYDTQIVTLGVIAGLVLWLADALVSGLMQPDRPWWDEILAPDPRQLLSRLLLMGICLIGTLVVAGIVRRRLRLDHALEESQARHQHILQTTMDGFCLLDDDGRLIESNPSYAQMSGYPIEELLTMRLSDVEVAETPGSAAGRIRRIRELGADRFETRHRRKDGSIFDVEASVLYRTEQDGQGGRFFCFLRDISDRKHAIETLELERTLYKDLVAAMPVGVYRCTVHYSSPLRNDAWEQRVELNLVSDGFCRILGVTREACAADAAIVVSRIHPEDQAEFARLNILGQTTLTPFNWEGRVLRDGELRWVHFTSLPRRLEDGDVIWTGVLADVTERKRAESERQRLEEQLRQREKMDAIGQLAGGIAHDFNNQLSGILGYAEILGTQLPDAEQRGYAISIRDAARRSADLAQRLLAFARKGKYRSVAIDMHALAGEVAALLRRGIDRRISVVLRLEAQSSTVMGDPTQLQNVLLNLGLNARDAMPQGGELVISTRQGEHSADGGQAAGPSLDICVSDTGIGMDAEIQRRLFEPFFTTKAVGKGTGLGLASAYGVIKNHGGAIHVWSEPGRGSRFTLSLPLVEALVVEPELAGSIGHPAHVGLILVVDDEPIVIAIVSDLLRLLGHQVKACGDPVEALDFYREHWQDVGLVILDMVMPRMGGKDLFLAMRGINPQIRAILSSGYSLDGEAQSIMDAGVRAFVQKPFDRNSLMHAMATTLQD